MLFPSSSLKIKKLFTPFMVPMAPRHEITVDRLVVRERLVQQSDCLKRRGPPEAQTGLGDFVSLVRQADPSNFIKYTYSSA